MDDVKPAQFFPGVPLYRQVQTGIEELIRHNPSSTELALSDAQLSERFGVRPRLTPACLRSTSV